MKEERRRERTKKRVQERREWGRETKVRKCSLESEIRIRNQDRGKEKGERMKKDIESTGSRKNAELDKGRRETRCLKRERRKGRRGNKCLGEEREE